MRIHHLALRTRDLPRLEAFYGSLLGLPVAARDGLRSVWLRAGDAVVMLEQAGTGEPAVPAGSGELCAFAVDEAARAALEQKLAAHGVPVESRTDFTVYFRDPDGRRVALSSYPLD